MNQMLSGIGAALILGAYAAQQFGRMSTAGRVYAVMNLVGSALLAGVAASEELWAFVVLNSVWGLVSLRRVLKPGQT